MQKRSLLVQVLLDMATGGGAKLEALIVDRAGTFDAGMNKGYNPVTVPSGSVNVLGERGTVDNHSIAVTPKAQVSQGWVNGGTLEGSAISVSANELVSGTLNVSQAGTSDVTNYKDVNVNAGGTTSYLERTTIDEHSVRLTPKADVTSGWQDTKTVVGESVDVDASGLVSGTYPVTASGEFDVTTYEKISVPSGVVSASAIKGVVANHSVLITPSATRTAGFINGGETTGQDVRVDASELVSGTLNISQPGDSDVTNYAEVSVPSGGHSASGVKGTVGNHSVSVTPRSTATAGFVTSGSVDGAPISVSASELVSGTLNVTDSGMQDVTNYQNISVPSASHSASANKGTVSNHSITVTPRSTATQGFLQTETVDGTPVTVSASELVSGRLQVTQNGIIDVTNYKEIEVSGVVEKTLLGSITTTILKGSSSFESFSIDTNAWFNYPLHIFKVQYTPGSQTIEYDCRFALAISSNQQNFTNGTANLPVIVVSNKRGSFTKSIAFTINANLGSGLRFSGNDGTIPITETIYSPSTEIPRITYWLTAGGGTVSAFVYGISI